MTAMQLGLQSCGSCSLLSRPAPGEDEGRCPRCDRSLSFRESGSVERTWAFLIAAAICYVPANLLPVLTTVTASGRDSDTILQGVVLLWSPTGWPLSLIVLVASIMIPSAKIVALIYLLVSVTDWLSDRLRKPVTSAEAPPPSAMELISAASGSPAAP